MKSAELRTNAKGFLTLFLSEEGMNNDDSLLNSKEELGVLDKFE